MTARNGRKLAAAVVLGLAALASGCGGEGGAVAEVGKPVPAYAATTVEGDSISLAGMRGKAVLLNVWATWCHPCREELPDLQRLHERHAPRGLTVVGVSVDDASTAGTDVRDFARRYGVTYPLWRDPDERVLSTFRAVGVPNTYLIAPDGTLLWKRLGPVKADDPELAAALERAMGKA